MQNLHMHSTWDDGKDTAQAMLETCLAAGMTSAGISLHSSLPFANDWAAAADALPGYLLQMRRLREAFAGRLRVYTGIEWDVLSADVDLSCFDYVIGSVHHLPLHSGLFSAVDDSEAETARILREEFAGDADAMAACYYAQLHRVAANPQVDIVGHFDLLTKFDERCGFFDSGSAVYRRVSREAMEALVAAGKIFEVNTGAISRGYRQTPYPSRALLLQLREMDGRVTISSDAHSTQGVTCGFDLALTLLRETGFDAVWQLRDDGFEPVRIETR